MRLLLIHDADEMRSHIAQQIVVGMPDVELTFWDPSRQEMPSVDYCKAFDVLMLDEHPGDGDGIDYLTTWQRSGPGMPPTLFMVSADATARTDAARNAGAAGCVIKLAISPASVASTLRGFAHRSRPLRTSTSDTVANSDGMRAAVVATPSLGIAGYRVLRPIGSASRSGIYLAQREIDGLAVVIKILEPALRQDPAFRARFIEETRKLKRLVHDHIVLIHNEALNEHQGYLIMEHCSGGDLATQIGANGLAPEVAMLLFAQIARGLEAAHGAGVIHRNLKPQNILFRNALHVALADFGLTRQFASAAAATPLYMSPEQCVGAQHDVRGDLYSLGAVLFHMLSGRPPYMADHPDDLAFQHVHGALPRLPAPLADYQPLINRLLAKRPEHRPRSATALLTELKQ